MVCLSYSGFDSFNIQFMKLYIQINMCFVKNMYAKE